MGKITSETHFRSQRADGRHITSFAAYPENEKNRKYHGEVPKYGLTFDEYLKGWCYCDVPEHAFKKEPSFELLKQAFGK